MGWANYPRGYAKKSKYGANKTEVDGITFDSRKEARRYAQLKLMERAGAISDLQLQVKFILIPAQREPDKTGKRGGVIKGKTIERECSYIADFVYIDTSTGKTVIEDAKGMKTEVYKIKKKLMLYVYGVQIKEV